MNATTTTNIAQLINDYRAATERVEAAYAAREPGGLAAERAALEARRAAGNQLRALGHFDVADLLRDEDYWRRVVANNEAGAAHTREEGVTDRRALDNTTAALDALVEQHA